MGWNHDHVHVWVLQFNVTWIVDGKLFVAACCKCGKAGWKLSPVQGVEASEYS